MSDLAEQKRIVRSLERSAKHIDSTTAQIQREIDLMREYRTRLIADAVTGKLDVRAAAAALPPEEEWTDEPLDAELEEDTAYDEAADEELDEREEDE